MSERRPGRLPAWEAAELPESCRRLGRSSRVCVCAGRWAGGLTADPGRQDRRPHCPHKRGGGPAPRRCDRSRAAVKTPLVSASIQGLGPLSTSGHVQWASLLCMCFLPGYPRSAGAVLRCLESWLRETWEAHPRRGNLRAQLPGQVRPLQPRLLPEPQPGRNLPDVSSSGAGPPRGTGCGCPVLYLLFACSLPLLLSVFLGKQMFGVRSLLMRETLTSCWLLGRAGGQMGQFAELGANAIFSADLPEKLFHLSFGFFF